MGLFDSKNYITKEEIRKIESWWTDKFTKLLSIMENIDKKVEDQVKTINQLIDLNNKLVKSSNNCIEHIQQIYQELGKDVKVIAHEDFEKKIQEKRTEQEKEVKEGVDKVNKIIDDLKGKTIH